jgi:8-oxo-dGTP pyrophosphatase MutT (NUDIX family)
MDGKNKLLFQYCQKIVVFSADHKKVLLAKRKGEADFDGIYSFIGGKMETTDKDFVEGMRREKNEEIGKDVKLEIFPKCTYNVYFTKKDKNSMVLPHCYARYIDGVICLNEEYSDFKWVELTDLDEFEPKIFSIPEAVDKVLALSKIADKDELITI